MKERGLTIILVRLLILTNTTDLTEKIRPKRQDFVAWGRQDEIRQVFISLNRLEKTLLY